MKTKIKYLAILLAAVCLTFVPWSNVTAFGADTVDVYLVMGEDAQVNSTAGTTFADLHINHAYKLTAQVGATLPVATRTGFEFVGWGYSSGALLKFATTVPNTPDTIYYARWKSNSPDIQSATTIDIADEWAPSHMYLQPIGTSDFLPQYRMQVGYSSIHNAREYKFSGILPANFDFVFASTKPLLAGQFTTYPHLNSGKQELGYSFDAADDANTYLKARNVANDASMTMNTTAEGLNTWFGYGAGNPAGNLRITAAGTYNMYVRIYENGGWVFIYLKKAA